MFPSLFVNRTVAYRFHGCDLRFHFSHALFSSHDVDEGSTLLLKTVAQKIRLPKNSRVLDLGCGTGVLGLSLMKAGKDLTLVSRDRDELACAFTRENAIMNGLENVDVCGGLDFDGVEGNFALILSNLPAKAGPPVLRHLVKLIGERLLPGGTAAVVVVKNLSDGVHAELKNFEYPITYIEDGPRHDVYHFQGSHPPKDGNEDPYIRQEAIWELEDSRVKLKSFWGLEDFDTLNHGRALLLTLLLQEKRVWKNAGFWNMGQGQLTSVLLHQKRLKGPVTLWDKDHLSLKACASNWCLHRGTDLILQPVSWAGAIPLPDQPHFELVAVFWEGEPQVKQEKEVFHQLSSQVAPGGIFAVSGPSSQVGRLLDKTPHFSQIRDKRDKGFRAVILKRQ